MKTREPTRWLALLASCIAAAVEAVGCEIGAAVSAAIAPTPDGEGAMAGVGGRF